jgi:hypothetical protein
MFVLGGKPVVRTRLVLMISLLVGCPCATYAQGVVTLSCGGNMTTYQPQAIAGTVAPGATVVDLENRTLLTPVGRFRIISASESSVSFDNPSDQGVVFGTLDRITGRLSVMWMTSSENEKRVRGQAFNMTAYADLNCTARQRLF